MKKKIYIPLIVIISMLFMMPSVFADSKASSQFKSYDKRTETKESSVTYKDHSNSLFNKVTNDGIQMGVDKALEYGQKYVNNSTQNYVNSVRRYVSNNMPAQSNYRNFSNYQQAVRNLRQVEQRTINQAQKTASNINKSLKVGGNLYNAYNIYNDIKDINKESKHKHSSLKQLALTTRYMKVLYNGGAMFYKPLGGAATASSFVNDAVESDEFVDWANEQDNAFLDFLDDATDAINDKAFRDACEILEWLGINPPNSLPALRTAIKPNIYLYPEETTDISVVFDSPELLLTVIPDYNYGWYPEVDPNSKMLIDGEEYGYLFYESMTGDYAMQKEEGFIVPIDGREEFFKEISEYYGFNEQETYDFVTFWCERLDKDKEYVMYPQLTSTIDVLMPVVVKPNPESIFRIWFLFYELEDDIELERPERVIAKRNGYTMVEWGGIVAE